MAVVSLNNLLIKIFKSHGFEINSSSDYSKYILATKDNINISIGYLESDEEVNQANVRNFFRTAKKDNADRLIYIIPKTKYPDNLDKFAADRNIQIWDRERLERELGKAIMANLEISGEVGEFDHEMEDLPRTGISMIPGSMENADSNIRPAHDGISMHSRDLASDEELPIMVPIISFDDENEMHTDTKTVSPTTMEHRMDHGEFERTYAPHHGKRGAGISTVESHKHWIIKPNITKENAANMASKIVRGFRFNLELIPYYIFSYTCNFESGSPQISSNQGLIGINGLTSNVEEWSGMPRTIGDLDEEHTKLEVKFPYDKAFSLAQQAIISLKRKS